MAPVTSPPAGRSAVVAGIELGEVDPWTTHHEASFFDQAIDGHVHLVGEPYWGPSEAEECTDCPRERVTLTSELILDDVEYSERRSPRKAPTRGHVRCHHQDREGRPTAGRGSRPGPSLRPAYAAAPT